MEEGGGTAPAKAVPCEVLAGHRGEEGLGSRDVEEAAGGRGASTEKGVSPEPQEG